MADARSADAVCAVAVRVISVFPRGRTRRAARRGRRRRDAGGAEAGRGPPGARDRSMSGSKIRDPFPQTHSRTRSLARQTAPPSASKTPSRARRRNDRQSMWPCGECVWRFRRSASLRFAAHAAFVQTSVRLSQSTVVKRPPVQPRPAALPVQPVLAALPVQPVLAALRRHP
jgi:hypothetical protein